MSLVKIARLLPRLPDPSVAAAAAAAAAHLDRRHSLLASIVSISRMHQVPPEISPNFEQQLPGGLINLNFVDEEGEGILECGRGDRRTKRGKISRGSFGKCRPNTKTALRRLREKWELPKGAPLPGPHEIA